ncbi:hypothetical protein TMatcc_009771 [Talaromyces marneffei ATCC 18224]
MKKLHSLSTALLFNNYRPNHKILQITLATRSSYSYTPHLIPTQKSYLPHKPIVRQENPDHSGHPQVAASEQSYRQYQNHRSYHRPCAHHHMAQGYSIRPATE